LKKAKAKNYFREIRTKKGHNKTGRAKKTCFPTAFTALLATENIISNITE